MDISTGRTSHADATSTLSVGAAAPDFTLKSQTGENWQLRQHRNKNIVLAFYPFAFSGV